MSDTTNVPNYKEHLDTLITQLSTMLPAEQLEVFNQDATQLATNYTQPLKKQVGDQAPAFSLPDATGKAVHSTDLLQQGAVVLTFYRGEWCPYCNLYLKSLQAVLPQIQAAGASLVAISPQKPDASLSMAEKNALDFALLTDEGNQVARQFTTVFKNGEAPLAAMAALGFDFDSFYEDDSQELPVPATFVIQPDGHISFAQSEGGDYRQRVALEAVLEAL